MDAQSAWQAAVGQLQIEMSKASFETWVRSAELVKYDQGTFTVGVQNAFARDWLEKRLTSTVVRLLDGLMEGPQKVEFIVYHKDYQESVSEPVAAAPAQISFTTPILAPATNTGTTAMISEIQVV